MTNPAGFRKKVFNIASYATILVAVLFSASCKMPSALQDLIDTPKEETGITLSFSMTDGRTIQPAIEMTPSSYEISGSGPEGSTFTQTTAVSPVDITGLTSGSWTVTVIAKNTANQSIGHGTGGTNILQSGKSDLKIKVAPYTGTGTLNLSLVWPADKVAVPTVQASLLPTAGAAIPLAFTLASGQAAFTQAVEAGYYTLSLNLLDSGTVVMGAVEVVRIVKGQTTSGSFNFSDLNIVTGSYQINISPELSDPLPVAISGGQTTLSPGSSMTLTATSGTDSANHTYIWYLNGIPAGTGPNHTFSAQTVGSYRLSVAVFSADGLRGGSASHSFTVAEQAVTDAVYVRAGATGTGTSWQDALPALPASLVRGKTYWMAGGTYAVPNFNTAVSGTSTIELRHATAQLHGSGTGWQDSYAANPTVFPDLVIASPYVILDGQSSGGIRVQGSYAGSAVTVSSHHVTLRNMDIDGRFATNAAGYHVAGSGTGLLITGADHEISNCLIHNIADDGVAATAVTRLLFRGNRIYDLMGCGTDTGAGWNGPVYNGHSDGLEITQAVDSIFEGNFVVMTNIGGTTSAFYMMDTATSASQYSRNLTVRNNVFYTQRSFAVYMYFVEGLSFVNNTVWGFNEGGPWGAGIAVCRGVSGLNLSNNIALFVRTAFDGTGFNAAQYTGDHNIFGMNVNEWPLASGDIVAASPGFVSAPGYTTFNAAVTRDAFKLVTGSRGVNAGKTIAGVTTDIAGTARPLGGVYDIGAFENY